jgi:hypothetical protein
MKHRRTSRRSSHLAPWLWMLSGCLSCSAVQAGAQINRSRAPSVHSNSLNGNTTITLSASPGSVSITLAATGLCVASAPITLTAVLSNPAVTTVNVYGFFTSASAALTGSSSSAAIPTSSVYGEVPGGVPTTYTAFTQTNTLGTAGTSLQLMSLSGLTTGNTSSASLWLAISLASTAHLPADTYRGTLYLQAQAF